MQPLVPIMTPAPGEQVQRFVGDRLHFQIRDCHGRPPVKGWRAFLRTNLGRAELLRKEIIDSHTRGLPLAGASWRDLPMLPSPDGWSLDLPLAEVGYFKAKAYLQDPRGWQHWPHGPDLGISVHPDFCRTANIIYCAFPRMFGPTRSLEKATHENPGLARMDKDGYTVIPPSGKLRDLTGFLPHIVDDLGCKLIQLLPVHPTPTTYARFGRYGSPYAALDLTAIDPALVVFDRQSTGVDQFCELTKAARLRGARVLLDIVINHTGWGSALQENHPEWFLREAGGKFVSPGAWGTVWEDLVELKHQNVGLWDVLAEVFLTWCRRGVDGFRCDAGYKVPVAAWQYIVARVQQEHPETVFLLEGLGGAWDATASLLTDGGLQWAYSELFQNYSGKEVATYLDHALRQTERLGLLVHFSETHDNARLAARGREWSLLRNRLCALSSISGGFAFTCGVEWLATEKLQVHGSAGMRWGHSDNIVPELRTLNRLLATHPCFFDGAVVTRLSAIDSPVLALNRLSADSTDRVLVLVNNDLETSQVFHLPPSASSQFPELTTWTDLLGQKAPALKTGKDSGLAFTLPPGSAYCLAPSLRIQGLSGDDYRLARARAAWALQAWSACAGIESVVPIGWQALAELAARQPEAVLAAIAHLGAGMAVTPQAQTPHSPEKLRELIDRIDEREVYPALVLWTVADARRITLVPPGHWLVIRDAQAFSACLRDGRGVAVNALSILVAGGHVACFPPRQTAIEATLEVERFEANAPQVKAKIRFLSPTASVSTVFNVELGANGRKFEPEPALPIVKPTARVLLTNGRGGMARLCVNLGQITSKYDCALAANLHPDLPVDRHVMAKRLRVWLNADGFLSPLDFRSIRTFQPGPPAIWDFVANAGDGRTVEVRLIAKMLPGKNTTVFEFSRPGAEQAHGKQLPAQADVRLTVRVDIEDRSFHGETKRNGGAEFHFNNHTHLLASEAQQVGFVFSPATDRQLRVFANGGEYHAQPEWCENIPHPIEQTRGQVGSGDAFSPGWFDLPLPKGAARSLVLTTEPGDDSQVETSSPVLQTPTSRAEATSAPEWSRSPQNAILPFEEAIRRATQAFLVRRGAGKTVIAGYPWFLDWGRDTFICARGLLAAGCLDEVQEIVLTFARFEDRGTLPNTIFGQDASNRDTSDAPLWFALVCEELAALRGPAVYGLPAGDAQKRTLGQVLASIAAHYVKGTPNGIHMDPQTGLIWSPSHFTWMDTNYPASTPREGYPVEIQILWIRFLRHLDALRWPAPEEPWATLANRAEASFHRLFWLPEQGWFSDVLKAGQGVSASAATADDALRSNCLFAVSLGVAVGKPARQCVAAAQRYLVIPGALRSLAPLPLKVPSPIYANHGGGLLNDPYMPYWGAYEGDEDTRRKPAYHNGTAWTWTFPVFCEALARSWDFAPAALTAARAYLESMTRLLYEGCLGHLPEVVDGDAPHTSRGCDAQAWAATEALRVARLLDSAEPRS